MQPAIGLSVGITNLAVVTADSSLIRRPVLTLYPHRQSEVGGPAENLNLTEPGLVIADFVNRVGASAGISAADGSTHRAEDLLADGLRALADAATGGSPLPDAVGVSYPAYWSAAAVAALRDALSRVSALSQGLLVVSEVAGALAALPTDSDVPAGIIAVCDFGGSGSTITFVDLSPGDRGGYAQLGASVRYPAFSGELIDQALVNHVVAELSAGGTFDDSLSSGIGSLTRLRAQCRDAKEQLSAVAATVMNVELPGFHGDIELTRDDLDDVIATPLAAFCDEVRSGLDHNGIGADLVAIAAVGGGANVPGIITTLSECFQVPVVTAPQPQFAAALGAALLSGEGRAGGGVAALARGGDAAVGAKPPMLGTVKQWATRPAVLALGGIGAVLAVAIGIAMLMRPHPTPAPPAVTTPSTTIRPASTTTTTTPIPLPPPEAPPPIDTAEPEVTEEPTVPVPTAPAPTAPVPVTPVPTATVPVTPVPTAAVPVTPTVPGAAPPTSPTSPTSEVPHIPHIPGLPRTPQ